MNVDYKKPKRKMIDNTKNKRNNMKHFPESDEMKSGIRIKRGGIYYADMGKGVGSEQNGIRPVLVLQNDTGNTFSPTTIVAIITSINKKKYLPVHLSIPSSVSGLKKDSTIMLEQIRTIDKDRILSHISDLDEEFLNEVKSRLSISLGF